MSKQAILTELLTGKVFKVRGQTVVFDFDAAALYEVNIALLHRAVTRHSQRFPPDFMFWLTTEEWKEVAEQIAPGLYAQKNCRRWLLRTAACSCFPAY